MLDKKMLEEKFSENFGSPFFPILADMYLSKGDIRRASKVCQVGLDHDSNNTDGKFILAKVAMAENKSNIAEKWLKQVVDENPAHFNGLRMLIKLEIKLSRSQNTIKKYINQLIRFLPHDVECKEWMDQLGVSVNNPAKQKIIKSESILKENSPSAIHNDKKIGVAKNKLYNVDGSMATFTMVQVLKAQKHYNQALAVLENLGSIGRDKNKIEQEKEEILLLISESQ